MEEKEKKKRTVKRSPNFPIISLKEAVQNTKKLYNADGRAGSQTNVAYKHLGYKGKHGASITVLSAMKKYGLVREERGTIYLTRDAEILIIGSDENEKKVVLRNSALRPDVHKKLWSEYLGRGLPSDATLRHNLIFNYGFNEKPVDGFIRNFRKTLDYAGISPGEESIEKEEGEEMIAEQTRGDVITFSKKVGMTSKTGAKVQDYLIPRKGDKIALLRLEKPVTNEDLIIIKRWLELLGDTIVDTDEPESDDKEIN